MKIKRGLYLKGEKALHWKGGVIKTQSNYMYIYMLGHPFCSKKTYVPLSHYVAESYLGRFLDPKEVVHHIDGNPENNLPENLYLFSSHSKHLKSDNRWYKNKLKSNII